MKPVFCFFRYLKTMCSFAKKKTLLLEKSFSINERIYCITSLLSDNSDWINGTLYLLLQRARVIHLNEVEIYFGEMNVDSPSEFYGPKNEWEALNYVLSCIDTVLSDSHRDGLPKEETAEDSYAWTLPWFEQTRRVVQCAGPRGHILNLGHDVLVGTPEDVVAHFFDVARSLSYDTTDQTNEEPSLVL